MKHFRLWLITLLIFLSIAINIDQFVDPQRSTLFSLHSLVSVIVLLGILLPILFPVIQKFSLVIYPLSLILVYFLLRVILSSSPNFSLNYGIQTIFEMIAIFLSGLLGLLFTKWASRSNLLSPNIPLQSNIEDIHETDQDDLKYEFHKTKQSDRPIALIALQPVMSDEKVKLKENHWLVYKTIKEVITTDSRQTDLTLGHTQEELFFLICPETNQIGAERLVNRIQASVQIQLGINLQHGIAIYPDDSNTYEELQRIAESRLGNPEN